MNNLVIFGGLGFVVVVILVLVCLFYFLMKPSKTTVIETPPAAPPPAPPPAGGCPSSPYTYCSTDTIKNVYYVNGCGPSTSLINKLISEKKITGLDDPKLINCSENKDLCTAAGIRSYPSVICSNTPKSVYEGYCA